MLVASSILLWFYPVDLDYLLPYRQVKSGNDRNLNEVFAGRELMLNRNEPPGRIGHQRLQ